MNEAEVNSYIGFGLAGYDETEMVNELLEAVGELIKTGEDGKKSWGKGVTIILNNGFQHKKAVDTQLLDEVLHSYFIFFT